MESKVGFKSTGSFTVSGSKPDDQKVSVTQGENLAVEFGSTDGFDVSTDHQDSVSVSMGAAQRYVTGFDLDYNELNNKPRIESVELKGNRTLDEFGLSKAANADILSLFKEG